MNNNLNRNEAGQLLAMLDNALHETYAAWQQMASLEERNPAFRLLVDRLLTERNL